MIVEFFEAALFDLKKSKKYYSDIEPDLGEYFLRDIEGALSDIKKFPKACPKHHKYNHLRLKTCKRFPFTVIYHPIFQEKVVYIVAVAHQKREPDYWRGRA
ncbi:type II toxin-antitoxin system RelE/ParE family toxin [Rhodohalobacter sp.]|uniref:type II toxin-antitoxin system RelE/ParE family toxin n=1 Tax=Rhodohalobacter sp. TaxID=1974210 RepID=UPI002ACEA311|nr:type II toxin-antitoxin system RelE/ParE family toxin [Rhodohalobacter sp.]MDZ7756745.1 type II toxin-antitoxin system RelE/ParE family toxin [Rhodohalobacter sp.]